MYTTEKRKHNKQNWAIKRRMLANVGNVSLNDIYDVAYDKFDTCFTQVNVIKIGMRLSVRNEIYKDLMPDTN